MASSEWRMLIGAEGAQAGLGSSLKHKSNVSRAARADAAAEGDARWGATSEQ
jgi:hypothetical protein